MTSVHENERTHHRELSNGAVDGRLIALLKKGNPIISTLRKNYIGIQGKQAYIYI